MFVHAQGRLTCVQLQGTEESGAGQAGGGGVGGAAAEDPPVDVGQVHPATERVSPAPDGPAREGGQPIQTLHSGRGCVFVVIYYVYVCVSLCLCLCVCVCVCVCVFALL